MNRVFVRCLALAALGMAVLFFSTSGTMTAADKDDKVTPIKEIMAKAHKGGDSILATLEKALKKKDEINWDAVDSKAKDLVLLAGDLGKNTPKKGEKASWEKLTMSYQENAKKLLVAAEKKEAAPATKAAVALRKSCGACHTAHK